jgi:ElaB/YqjD/DUF883 family membrane-anchored ribosome-binding protein
MNQRTDQTVAHQAADVVDNVADGIRSAAHTVGGSVRNAAHTVREAAGRAAGAVGDTYDEAGQFAREAFDHSRARVHSWENRFESYIRHNPKTSLFLAAALGTAIGALIWKRK